MDFNKHKVKTLLDKFWEGETSLEEEKWLEDYFHYSDQVPSEFDVASAYFATRKRSHEQQELGADFDEELLAKLDKADGPTKVISLNYFWRVAAAVLIVGGALTFWWNTQNSDSINTRSAVVETSHNDTYENPEAAFQATKEALFMMSSKFNEGTSEVQKIQKLNKAQETIKKKK